MFFFEGGIKGASKSEFPVLGTSQVPCKDSYQMANLERTCMGRTPGHRGITIYLFAGKATNLYRVVPGIESNKKIPVTGRGC